MQTPETLNTLTQVLHNGRAVLTEAMQGAHSSIHFDRSITHPVNCQANFTVGSERNEIENTELANLLFTGDNLTVMQSLIHGTWDTRTPDNTLAGKIDLIYIDPPFASGSDYQKRIRLAAQGDSDKAIMLRQDAYQDNWKGGLQEYLTMLYPRLGLMRELLSDRGSLYVHVDYRVSHWVRLLLDDIFGADHFLNEIIWNKGFRGTRSNGIFQHAHDVIFWYAKSKKQHIWNQVHEDYKDTDMSRYNKTDDNGRRYALIKRRRTDGSVYYGKTYPSELGKRRNDVISDIPTMASTDGQRVGFDTQKPQALLRELILAASNEDSIVADFFSGSGSTAIVAETLQRNWIVCDRGAAATALTARRVLLQPDCRPFQILQPSQNDIDVTHTSKLAATVTCKEHTQEGSTELLVELQKYTTADGKALQLSDNDLDIVKRLNENDAFAMLDSIELDFAYDGNTFHSRWQAVRPFTTAHAAPARLPESYTVLVTASNLGDQVAIRVTDVFGHTCTLPLTVPQLTAPTMKMKD